MAHEVPLSQPATAILRAVTRRDDRNYVFGAADGPFQGWSNAKAALDERITKAICENAGASVKLKAWRVHDLRRTAATRLADLGTQPHVIEAILNHVSGHRAGVARIYNRATYSAEKREALNRWRSPFRIAPRARRGQVES